MSLMIVLDRALSGIGFYGIWNMTLMLFMLVLSTEAMTKISSKSHISLNLIFILIFQ